MVDCPICSQQVRERDINAHLDSECKSHVITGPDPSSQSSATATTPVDSKTGAPSASVASFFKPLATRRNAPVGPSPGLKLPPAAGGGSSPARAKMSVTTAAATAPAGSAAPSSLPHSHGFRKRVLEQTSQQSSQQELFDQASSQSDSTKSGLVPNGGAQNTEPSQRTDRTVIDQNGNSTQVQPGSVQGAASVSSPFYSSEPAPKKARSGEPISAPLAERMRPRSLDEVCGQDLVGKSGILRGLISQGRIPSLILWGPPGTGKTTIARLVAAQLGMRFVEINSTSAGVAECKKIFGTAKNELGLTGRSTLLFCDEIHRFSKAQQDVFLGPVEAGVITLIGATTENPSFKIINALLSRCRVFTLSKLDDEEIKGILRRALAADPLAREKGSGRSILDRAVESEANNSQDPSVPQPEESLQSPASTSLITEDLLTYIAAFANGDARMALNLLELAISLDQQAGVTPESLKKSLTQTLLYDRAGDAHYDTISAFHKSVRGSDPDAALFYLARMIVAGEDPLFIARRMIVMASEDIGLADNTLLPLAIATHSAVEKVGLPEARINLAHTAVALALAPKSTRAYRGLGEAMKAIEDVMSARSGGGSDGEKYINPGALDVPLHLRQGATKLMKDLGYGHGYKYNPDYRDGKVKQEYLPEAFRGRKFLRELDLGTMVDPDLEPEHEPGDDPMNL